MPLSNFDYNFGQLIKKVYTLPLYLKVLSNFWKWPQTYHTGIYALISSNYVFITKCFGDILNKIWSSSNSVIYRMLLILNENIPLCSSIIGVLYKIVNIFFALFTFFIWRLLSNAFNVCWFEHSLCELDTDKTARKIKTLFHHSKDSVLKHLMSKAWSYVNKCQMSSKILK